MRVDDERQLVAAGRAVLPPRQKDVSKGTLARRRGAGIPRRPLEGRAVGVRRHLDELETGSFRKCRYEAEGDYDDKPGSMHRVSPGYAGRHAFTVEPSLQRLQSR